MVVCVGTVCMWNGERVKVSSTFQTEDGVYVCLRDPKTGKPVGNAPIREMKPVESGGGL